MFPRSFSHLGISVNDITQAIDFYTQALGCYLMGAPVVVREGDGSVLGQLLGRMLGPGWGRLTVARLITPDRIGIDLFEIADAGAARAELAPGRTGTFHLHTRDVDTGELAKRIIAYGGTHCGCVRAVQPGEQPYTVIRCEDPFGNIIEIFTTASEPALSYAR